MISGMNLTNKDRVGLESLLRRDGYDGSVAARAQIVLWRAEGHSAPEIARMARTTKPTVYKWIARFEEIARERSSYQSIPFSRRK